MKQNIFKEPNSQASEYANPWAGDPLGIDFTNPFKKKPSAHGARGEGELKKSTLYILEATSDVSQELQARLAFASWKSFARHHAVIYRT